MQLISYDIENDRLRLRIAKRLLHYGLHRVQYSVFMGSLSKKDIRNLWKELGQWMQGAEAVGSDSILYIPVHRGQLKTIQVHGSWPDRWEEISGEVHTLML